MSALTPAPPGRGPRDSVALPLPGLWGQRPPPRRPGRSPHSPDADFEAGGQVLGHKLAVTALVVVHDVLPRETCFWVEGGAAREGAGATGLGLCGARSPERASGNPAAPTLQTRPVLSQPAPRPGPWGHAGGLAGVPQCTGVDWSLGWDESAPRRDDTLRHEWDRAPTYGGCPVVEPRKRSVNEAGRGRVDAAWPTEARVQIRTRANGGRALRAASGGEGEGRRQRPHPTAPGRTRAPGPCSQGADAGWCDEGVPRGSGRGDDGPLTFRVLPGRSALGAEGLPSSAAVPEAPALGHLAGAVLQALVSAGRPSDRLGLGGPLPLGSRTAGAGEDTVFQTDLLTAPMGRMDRRTDTHRETAGEVTLDRTLAPGACCRPTPAPREAGRGAAAGGGRRSWAGSGARWAVRSTPGSGCVQEPSLAGRWSVDPQVTFGCTRRGRASPLSC